MAGTIVGVMDQDEDLTCPHDECNGLSFAAPQGLGSHMYSVHGYTGLSRDPEWQRARNRRYHHANKDKIRERKRAAAAKKRAEAETKECPLCHGAGVVPVRPPITENFAERVARIRREAAEAALEAPPVPDDELPPAEAQAPGAATL